MRVRFTLLLCSGTALFGLIGAAAASAALHPPGKARYLSKPLSGVSAARLRAQSAAGLTVPLWSSSIKSFGGTSYKYTMVGKTPFVKQSNASASIAADVIPVKITMADTGTVLDPTAPNTACGVSTSPDTRTLQSPLFANHSYTVGGTNVGNVEYEDAFMRENFAKQVFGTGALNPGYGVVLVGANHPVLSVTVPTADGQTYPTSQSGACGPLGLMDFSYWDSLVQNTLIPDLVAANETSPRRMVVLLLADVVMDQGSIGSCCILGYHSSYRPSSTSGVQYYATADYDSTGLFTSGNNITDDVSALSHELGEWLNDPNGNNATPAWGHIGQVSGCQANLEVGDPLSGVTVAVNMPNGLAYHPQELAFLSWFYRQTPSIGVNGWYSSNGTFTKGAGPVCS